MSNAPECGLEHAIDALRDDVPVRAAWRNELLHSISEAPTPARARATYWRVSPALAIAAAVGFMMVGSASTYLLQSRFLPVAGDSTAPTSIGAQPASFVGSDATTGVRFTVIANASRVSVVGDFNGWNPTATPLKLSGDGRTWIAMLPLSAGRHTYAFVIDGEVMADPSAPRAPEDDFGTPSSLVLVSASR